MSTFWQSLKRPIFALAPMENVTDTVFRRIVIRCGAPDVFFTEFTRVEQVSAYPRRGLPWRMRTTEGEYPLIVQIWGTDPELYYRSAAIIAELGYAGVDINMGCPVRKIRNKGSCSGLIVNQTRAAEIIAATREGAQQRKESPLPVSVKTRIGYDRPAVDEWIGFLLQQQINLLTIHGRTAFQESEGRSDTDAIARAVALRDRMAPQTLIMANGDITSRSAGTELCGRIGTDGVMIGRGIFSEPFIFSSRCDDEVAFLDKPAAEKLDLMKRHITLHRETWNGHRNYEVLKRFYKIYLVGFDGAMDLRERLNHTLDYDTALREIAEFEAAR